MKTEKIDEMIKEALSAEEAKFYETLHEQSLPEMLSGLYGGKMKWLNVYGIMLTLVFIGLAVYCLIQFLEVESANEVIRWGFGMLLSVSAVQMVKLWFWNQMDKNAIIREIKRLELTVAHFASKRDK